jgi:hypothetical protein
MKINLKKLTQDKEALKAVQREMTDMQGPQKAFSKKLNAIIAFYDEIERDLEMCGESIVELDKERLAAIEERNKMLAFMKHADDM